MPRPDGRSPLQLRPVSLECDAVPHAEGSCLVTQGKTRVLIAATLEQKVPPFLRDAGEGWVTAEYGMLPRATLERSPREAARGKQASQRSWAGVVFPLSVFSSRAATRPGPRAMMRSGSPARSRCPAARSGRW